jgi:hypothetical protein
MRLGGAYGGGWGVSIDGLWKWGCGIAEEGLLREEETYITVRVWVCGLFSRVEGGRRVGVSWASLRGGGTVGVRDGVYGGESRGR